MRLRRVLLGLRSRDNNEPIIALPDKVLTDLKGGEVLAPQWDEGEQRDHQFVAVTDRVGHPNRSTWEWQALIPVRDREAERW